MGYVNDLSRALDENGIHWMNGVVITPRYIQKLGLVDANPVGIMKMIEEGIKEEEIVFQNKVWIEKYHSKEVPHYTSNDLPEGIPYDLLVGKSRLYGGGSSPRKIINDAQELITLADDKNFSNTKKEISRLKKSTAFAENILKQTAEFSSGKAFEDIYPDLGKVGDSAMDGFKDLISKGFEIKSSEERALKEKLSEIKNARQRIRKYDDSELEAILSVDLNKLSGDYWGMIQGKAQLK